MTDQGGHDQGSGPSVPSGAEGTGFGGRRRSAKGPTAVVAAATLVVGGLAAAVATGPDWLTGGTAAAATVSATGPLPGAQGTAALRRLASQVAALPNDVGTGRYAVLKTETWADREPDPEGPDGTVPAGVVVPYHERRSEWFADDHSGKWVADSTPSGGAVEHDEVVEPPLEPADIERRFRTLPTDDAGYRALVREELDGVLPWVIEGDDGDEEDVARYLAKHEDPSPYLSLMIVAWQFADSDDGGHQPRTPQERAAVLRYLATLPGVVVTGGVTDPAGRTGIAVTMNAPADIPAGGGNITLLFDRRSGDLLATRTSFHDLETPLTDLRYRHPDDRVVVVHSARFADHVG
jgi:hypothetical protein